MIVQFFNVYEQARSFKKAKEEYDNEAIYTFYTNIQSKRVFLLILLGYKLTMKHWQLASLISDKFEFSRFSLKHLIETSVRFLGRGKERFISSRVKRNRENEEKILA